MIHALTALGTWLAYLHLPEAGLNRFEQVASVAALYFMIWFTLSMIREAAEARKARKAARYIHAANVRRSA